MEEENTETPPDPQTLQTRIKIFKVAVVCCALVCVIVVIFVLSKSSGFFATLFALGTQLPAKAYLSANFKSYMCTLYLSIFGFVVCVTDTIIFFYKFTQKDKMLIFHVIFFLLIFISGMVTLVNPPFEQHMTSLVGLSYSSPLCTAGPYLFECLLAPYYLSYRSNVVSFFIVFCIFFALYTGLYHYAVKKLLPYQIQQTKKDEMSQNGQGDEKKSTIFNSNKRNETFVSEMFDDYLN